MNDAALEILLYRIISGKFYFFYKNDTYELRQPSIDIKYESEILYNKIIYEEKYNEWLREDNLDRILTTLGLWTMDTKTILKSLDKSIDDTKVRLYEQRASTKAVKDNKKKLKTTRNQINRLLNSKSDIFSHTLEGYASSIKNEHVICNTLYKDNKLVFDKGIKNNEHSYTLFNNLVKEINEHVLDSPQFKLLARSDMWRIYWNANRGNVFPGSASEWSFDQRTLVNVSRMYDNVHEHPECPEEEVIKDDDMLEGWMVFEKRKAESKKKQERVDNLNPKLKKAQEVFLMSENQSEVSEVLSMNSIESKRKMKQRSDHLDRTGKSTDFEFPDIKMDLRAKSVEMQRQNRRK